MALQEVITGVSGTFKYGSTPTAAKEMKAWTVRPRVDSAKWASNDGGGWRRTSTGIKEWDATVTLFLNDTAAIPLGLGTLVDLVFDVDGSDTDKYTGEGKIISHGDVTVDVDSPDGIEVEVEISGHGALTVAGTILGAMS